MSPQLLNEGVQTDTWEVATPSLTDCCLLVHQHFLMAAKSTSALIEVWLLCLLIRLWCLISCSIFIIFNVRDFFVLILKINTVNNILKGESG